MAFHRGPKIITDGMILYLDAANPKSYPGIGTTWYDLSRSGNNGTLVDKGTFPQFNTGGYFELNASQITISSIVYTTNFSFSMWIMKKGNGPNGYSTLISRDSNIGFWLYSDRITYYFSGDHFSTGYIYTNIWYNITFVGNGLTGTFYINGVTSGVINSTNSTFNTIGWDATSEYFIGKLALVNVYNRSLSDSEVLQNYNATKTRFIL